MVQNIIRKTLLSMLVMLVLLPGCESKSSDPQKSDEPAQDKAAMNHPENQAGLELFKQGDFSAAARRFEKAEQSDPAVAEFPNNAGMCYLHEGDGAKAEKKFQRAVALKPKESLYHYNLALARMQQQKVEKAVVDFQTAVSLKGDYFDAWAHLGTLHYGLKQPAEAETAWRNALKAQYEPEIATRLGVLLMQGGKEDEAEQIFRKAAQKAPKFELPHYNLGILYQQQKKYALAETHYRRAIQLKPKNFAPYYNLGLVQKAQGKNAVAAATFENFIEVVPPNMVRQIADAREQIKSLRARP